MRRRSDAPHGVPPKGLRNCAALPLSLLLRRAGRPRRSESSTRLSAVPGTGRRLPHSPGRCVFAADCGTSRASAYALSCPRTLWLSKCNRFSHSLLTVWCGGGGQTAPTAAALPPGPRNDESLAPPLRSSNPAPPAPPPPVSSPGAAPPPPSPFPSPNPRTITRAPPPVRPVEPDGVGGLEPAHGLAQVRAPAPHQQVVMVVHQHEGRGFGFSLDSPGSDARLNMQSFSAGSSARVAWQCGFCRPEARRFRADRRMRWQGPSTSTEYPCVVGSDF